MLFDFISFYFVGDTQYCGQTLRLARSLNETMDDADDAAADDDDDNHGQP